MQTKILFGRVNFELVHPFEKYGTAAMIQISIFKGTDRETTNVVWVVDAMFWLDSLVRFLRDCWRWSNLLRFVLIMVNLRFLHLATAVQVITFVEMIHDYSLVLQRGVPRII